MSESGTECSRTPSTQFESTRTKRKRKVVPIPAWAKDLPPESAEDELRTPSARQTESPSEIELLQAGQDSDCTSIAQPQDAYSPAQVERSCASSQQQDTWWTFTLPSKYLIKVQNYVNHASLLDRTTEPAPEKSPKHDVESSNDTSSSQHNLVARNFLEPSWASPWSPFRHEQSGSGLYPTEHLSTTPDSTQSKFLEFILKNPFAPLVFRFFNVLFNVCALASASRIKRMERQLGADGIIGSSTMMVIVISPVSMVHIVLMVYIEYFGRPIGLWRFTTKMAHTLTELIFICLYSSILSVSFDDILTSPLQCVRYNRLSPLSRMPPLQDIHSQPGYEGIKNQICNLQAALITLVFISVGLYLAVLVISLSRIFVKVNRS